MTGFIFLMPILTRFGASGNSIGRVQHVAKNDFELIPRPRPEEVGQRAGEAEPRKISVNFLAPASLCFVCS